jgi:hypothetical protein
MERWRKFEMWISQLTEREQKEVAFARVYAEQFAHGTAGHNRLLLIAKLADLLSQDDVKPDEETWFLARAIEGEGAGFFENWEEVGSWIAHTAINRAMQEWWPDTVKEIVISAFHGYVNCKEPQERFLELAERELDSGVDVAQGCFFMLSGTDLRHHGWSSEKTIKVFKSDEGHELHFSREWPGD